MRPHQDETGEEGVVIFPEGGRKKVRMGNKVSADKIRQAEHESGGQMRDQHETNMAKVKIETNDEAGNFWQLWGLNTPPVGTMIVYGVGSMWEYVVYHAVHALSWGELVMVTWT